MNSSNPILRIGVVGAGTMGRGIIQLFAQAGYTVFSYDAVDGAVRAAIDNVSDLIRRGVDKGRITAAQAANIVEHLRPCEKLSDLSGCDLVIEAIVEDMSVKQALFAELESVVRPEAILASNTSSLVVSEIAARCRHPQRVAGLHFFNPVPLMKVAEVIAAVRTSPENIATLKAVVESTGHRAVIAADQPGFLVNHAGRGLYTEGLRLVEEQCASPQDIDELMREAAGFRMGPFELLDLTGLDVSGRVMDSIYHQFQEEPRFRPSSLVPPRIAAGLFGRKSGEGWYRYRDGEKITTAAQPSPQEARGVRVWIDTHASRREELSSLAHRAAASLVDTAEKADVIIIQPWGEDATSYCVAHGLNAAHTVALDPLPALERRRTLMLTAVTSAHTRDLAHGLLSHDGTPVTLINDSPGFVLQRILAVIVNIATNIVQRGIASVADLEDAVRLGLGYPMGPLELGDSLGAKRLLTILDNMHRLTGDPRYRPTLWLQRRVALGVSLRTQEAART